MKRKKWLYRRYQRKCADLLWLKKRLLLLNSQKLMSFQQKRHSLVISLTCYLSINQRTKCSSLIDICSTLKQLSFSFLLFISSLHSFSFVIWHFSMDDFYRTSTNIKNITSTTNIDPVRIVWILLSEKTRVVFDSRWRWNAHFKLWTKR